MDATAIFKDLPTIITPRLVLRKLQIEDLEACYNLLAQPEVALYNSWEVFTSVETVQTFLTERILERAKQGLPTLWGVCEAGSGKLFGVCGFKDWDEKDARAEIAYSISRDYWGHGYAPEVAQAVVDFGFEKLKLNRIQATCDSDNLASERVMQKIGMQFEGLLREYSFSKGRYENIKIYAVLRTDAKNHENHENQER